MIAHREVVVGRGWYVRREVSRGSKMASDMVRNSCWGMIMVAKDDMESRQAACWNIHVEPGGRAQGYNGPDFRAKTPYRIECDVCRNAIKIPDAVLTNPPSPVPSC